MSSNSGQFDKLKKEWLVENGYEKSSRKNAGETALLMKMRGWIDGMLKEMMKEDTDETYEGECEKMNTGTEKMKKGEKEVCALILKNLLNIKTMSGAQCGIGSADERMKEYVQCAILKMWSALYLTEHCHSWSAVESAFNAVKNLGILLGGGSECKECGYNSVMEHMEVGKMNILGVIRGAIEEEPKVMGLIKSTGEKKDCKGQEDPLTKLGLQTNGGATTTTSTSGQQQHQTHQGQNVTPQPKKMTTQQFNFISKLITNWVKTHGMKDVDKMGVINNNYGRRIT
ncbi:SICA antigen [Plasmodium coatneyi]|uniref:SICA antigen n=1 Tax=Plasmodium coatneyi TaxID=208452 RepID=A0A1B1DXU7_9APIC|nr:SICA antigen [Plasmodium coatneyi]ANQ07425.1 SICA antigen [Plasmodium coatneyi]